MSRDQLAAAESALKQSLDENERLRAFVQDVADFGLRADLMPTVPPTVTNFQTRVWYQAYLVRVDEAMRARAREVLRDGS